jgi:hypothetical protein
MIIKNECTKPPRSLITQVRRSLGWISPLDLDGIAFVRLMNEIEEPHANSPDWHKRAKAEELCVTGQYSPKQGKSPAHIILYANGLYRGVPSVYRWTTVQTLNICYTLAHEVAHHLVARRGYVFQPDETFPHDENEEEFCNRYAFGVSKKMMKRWHYRLGMWALRDLAGWYYAFGCADWKDKNFKKASERFETAFHLDRNHTDALYWYWRAKDERNA